MFEIVEGIHKAFRIESTWAFVLLVVCGAGLVGGFFALIIDLGYKNSPEYRAEHPDPKSQAVASLGQTSPATPPSTAPTSPQSSSQASQTVTPSKPKQSPQKKSSLSPVAGADTAKGEKADCVGTVMQVEGNSYGNSVNGMELNGKQPCDVLKAIPVNGRAPHDNSVTDLKVNPKPQQAAAPPSQSCPNGVCIAGDNNGVATVNNYANAPRPPDPHDPYSSKTDQEVARLANDEATKVEDRSSLCIRDAAAVASGQQPMLNIDATVLATRTHFRWFIKPEIETIKNLHDSMLRRMPSAREELMESDYCSAPL